MYRRSLLLRVEESIPKVEPVKASKFSDSPLSALRSSHIYFDPFALKTKSLFDVDSFAPLKMQLGLQISPGSIRLRLAEPAKLLNAIATDLEVLKRAYEPARSKAHETSTPFSSTELHRAPSLRRALKAFAECVVASREEETMEEVFDSMHEHQRQVYMKLMRYRSLMREHLLNLRLSSFSARRARELATDTSLDHLREIVAADETAKQELKHVSTGVDRREREEENSAPPRPRLNEDQSVVLKLALNGHSLYIGGNAGTGKSMLLREIVRALKEDKGLEVGITGSTGMAANNLSGETFYQRLNLGIGLNGGELSLNPKLKQQFQKINFEKLSKSPLFDGSPFLHTTGDQTNHLLNVECFDLDAIRTLDVIVIDEVSLLPANFFVAFEKAARSAKAVDTFMGGIQIILSGDFMQLAPLKDNEVIFQAHQVATAAAELGRQSKAYRALRAGWEVERIKSKAAAKDRLLTQLLCESELFHRLVHVRLEKNERQQDADFRDALLSLRGGNGAPLLKMLERLGNTSDTELAIDDPSITRLYPLRRSAREHNSRVLDQLDGSLVVFAPIVKKYEEVLPNDHAVTLQCNSLSIMTELKAKFPSCWEVPYSSTRMKFLNSPELMKYVKNHSVVQIKKPRSQKLVPCKMKHAKSNGIDDARALPVSLKVGCRVVLTSNISHTYVNGRTGVVEDFVKYDEDRLPPCSTARHHYVLASALETRSVDHHEGLALESDVICPVVRFFGRSGAPESKAYLIPWTLSTSGCQMSPDGTEFPEFLCISMPLQVAYALTIHKVQGITITGQTVVDLRCLSSLIQKWQEKMSRASMKSDFSIKDFLTHLVYVAASRVTKIENLFLIGLEPEFIVVNRKALHFSESIPSAQMIKQVLLQ